MDQETVTLLKAIKGGKIPRDPMTLNGMDQTVEILTDAKKMVKDTDQETLRLIEDANKTFCSMMIQTILDHEFGDDRHPCVPPRKTN